MNGDAGVSAFKQEFIILPTADNYLKPLHHDVTQT